MSGEDAAMEALRLLVIDSDSVRRGMVACTLPGARYRIEFAGSAEVGLDLLQVLQPEIVIIGHDCAPPDLCQRVRALPAGYGCLLVLMDERFLDEVAGQEEASAVGADTFIPFPFDRQAFEERVQAPLKKRLPLVRGPQRARLDTAEQQTLMDRVEDGKRAPSEVRPADWEQFRAKVTTIHKHLQALNYYQLLQIPETATGSEVKEAYFSRSMEFHPDRFLQLEDEDLKIQIYEIYKRMSEAFKVLVEPVTRRYYDVRLGNPPESSDNLRSLELDREASRPADPTSDATSPTAKRYLHLAIMAQAEERLRSARTYLTLALQHEPENEALQRRLKKLTDQLKG